LKMIKKCTFLEINVYNKEATGSVAYCFLDCLASGFTNIFINQYKLKVIDSALKKYHYLNCEEKKLIIKNSLHKFTEKTNIFEKRWKAVINQRLLCYFYEYHSLNIDGFFAFRLQDFRREIEKIVEDTIEDFLIEKEYEDFLRLIRHFVKNAKSKFDMVHLIFFKHNYFRLYNEKMIPIDTNPIPLSYLDNDINFEDILISSLISIAPKSVTIHKAAIKSEKSMLNTIINIFGEKEVILCKGCPKCSKD